MRSFPFSGSPASTSKLMTSYISYYRKMPAPTVAPSAVSLVSAELAGLIHDVSRQLRVAAHAEANLVPLPDSERDVLRFVARRPGISISVVARELQMKSSNVSAAVRSLVQRGLMVREADREDRRIACLTLTDVARQNIERIDQSWDRQLGAALSRLEPGDRAALMDAVPALRSLITVLREERRAPGP
jgi:DNA-binding MarR family transcriptional regulator